MRVAVLVAVALVATTLQTRGVVAEYVQPKHIAQVWFCLERCGSDRNASLQQLADIRAQPKGTITHISMEAFDLGANGTLIDNGFSNLVPEVIAAGMTPILMVTTVSLTYIQQLTQTTPDMARAFIYALLHAVEKKGAKGADFDFEPNRNGQEYDAQSFALFLSMCTQIFNAHGLSIGADVATWNAFWDFRALGMSTTNLLTTMNTYVTDASDFSAAVDYSMEWFDRRTQLVVGLLKPLTDDVVTSFTGILSNRSLCRVALWDSPVPSNFWPLFSDVRKRCA